MARVLLIHGPNLNALGRRDPEHYGHLTLSDLVSSVDRWATAFGYELEAFQSNHEGALIDRLQDAVERVDGALVNFGALSHTSYALHDALLDFGKPAVEVHLSRISTREPWRRLSVVRPACIDAVEGRGVDGYREALKRLVRELRRLGS